MNAIPNARHMAENAASNGGDFAFAPQQTDALRDVSDWYRKRSKTQQIYRLFGFAGTGKTTLARHLAAEISTKESDVVFAAYTGKAALMLMLAGCASASTIHGIIYKAKALPNGGFRFSLNRDGPVSRAKLIVIDECSMVDEGIARDLMSFGKPILVLGDPAQLPPVSGAGYFTEARPDSMLTEIHRQAKGNPIIRAATAVREGRPLPFGRFGSVVIGKRRDYDIAALLEGDQIIVGRNATRKDLNSRIRAHLGFETPYPHVGDRLVCLRNDQELGLLNGGLFETLSIGGTARADHIPLKVRSQDQRGPEALDIQVHSAFFEGDPSKIDWKTRRLSQEMDYGYALTCHKSQGSQWNHVIVFDEASTFGADANRWLYTAITRASEHMTLLR